MGDKIFSSLFANIQPFEEYRDFNFVVEGKAFKIHRIIFASRSNAFVNIFKSHQKEAMIEDVSAETFEEIVKYVYTGEVNVTDKNQRDILAAAEKFGLKEIVNVVQLHRNLKMDPLRAKEIENLKHKYDEAKYLFEKTKARYAMKNPFSQPPNIYY